MIPTKKDHIRQRPTRTIFAGLAAVLLAVGSMMTFGAVGAEDADPQPFERKESATAAVTGGATFFPVTPYRAYDSRAETTCTDDRGPLSADETRIVDVVTDEGCTSKIPSENLVAVSYNLTVAATVDGGFLAVFPTGTDWPGNSSINWTESGQVIANSGVVAVGEAFEENGFILVQAGPTGETEFIVDITGYYAE